MVQFVLVWTVRVPFLFVSIINSHNSLSLIWFFVADIASVYP